MPTRKELEKLKKAELCDYCRKHKIKGYSGKTKQQRIDLIVKYYKDKKLPILTKKQELKTIKPKEIKRKTHRVAQKKLQILKKINTDEEMVYLEFRGGTSNKFYEIILEEDIIQIRYGRIGSDGRISRSKFGSHELAKKEFNKTLKSKLSRGYIEKKYTITGFASKKETKKGIKPKKTASKKPSRPNSGTSGTKRINPMLAGSGDQFLGNPDYIAQQKYDGTRCIIIKKNGIVKMIGRSWKSNYAPNFPEIVKDIHQIPLKSFILDSELTFFKGKKDVFLTALSKKENRKGMIAKCMVFDVLEIENKDVRNQPLRIRNELLSKIIPGNLKHLEVVKSYKTNHKKFFEDIISDKNQGEGIVLKKLDGVYNEGGRTKNWIKVKGWKSDEAIIVGITRGKGARSLTFGALILAQYDKGSLKFVGKTSGFKESEIHEILRKIRPHTTKTPQIIGIPSSKVRNWVNPEIVVEVKFHERTEQGKFRHPSFLRLRHDKTPKECKIN